MKKIRLIVFSFFFLLIANFPVFASEEKLLIFAADPWCPYNCKPESNFPGYLVEIAREAYQPFGYRIKYINLPWARALQYAKEGIINGAIGAVRGNISGHYIGQKILGKDETIIVVRNGERFDYTGTPALDTKRLGIIIDYTYDNHGPIDRYIERRRVLKKRGGISVLYQESALENLFSMLLLNRIDAFFENRYVANYKAKELKASGNIDIITTGKGDDIFIAFTPNKEGRKLAKILDEGVRKLRISGKLKDILTRYGVDDWE